MLRLFFALAAHARAERGADRAGRRRSSRSCRRSAVPAENLHATLCFIGAVEDEKLDALRAAAASIRGRPATLRFDALEYWETPKILCATAPGCVGGGASARLARAR